MQACASCHDPAHAFGPASAAPVELGGEHMARPGLRAVPTLRYLQAVPAFTEHYYDSEDEGDESVDNGPTGGLTWDGRVDRGANQAKIPLPALRPETR
nr:cytochrome-c peroxidase [Rhizobium bangladeshense]